jgi:hypothetical protein
MEARALVRIYHNTGEQIVNIYKSHEGYPRVFGVKIANYLKETSLRDMSQVASGLFMYLQRYGGGIYLYPLSYTDLDQDYVYHIHADKQIKCIEWDLEHNRSRKLFNGSADKFLKRFDVLEK